jgi:TonB family protein
MKKIFILILLIFVSGWLVLAQNTPAPKKEKQSELDESIDLNELKQKLDLFKVTRDVVNANIGNLMAIHQKYKAANPGNVGQMVVKVTLKKDGTVDKCKVVRNDIKDDKFSDEIVTAVQTWKFGPMTKEGQEVLIPFFFK